MRPTDPNVTLAEARRGWEATLAGIFDRLGITVDHLDGPPEHGTPESAYFRPRPLPDDGAAPT